MSDEYAPTVTQALADAATVRLIDVLALAGCSRQDVAKSFVTAAKSLMDQSGEWDPAWPEVLHRLADEMALRGPNEGRAN